MGSGRLSRSPTGYRRSGAPPAPAAYLVRGGVRDRVRLRLRLRLRVSVRARVRDRVRVRVAVGVRVGVTRGHPPTERLARGAVG